jgi:uncharacterized glyoxalase superfamily protein PhnB
MGMRTYWTGLTAGCLLFAAACLAQSAQSPAAQPPAAQPPELQHTCLISSHVRELAAFYEPILQTRAQWSGSDYVEFPTGGVVLAIYSAQAQERYIPGSAIAGQNHSLVLEFRVRDVDAEYTRLQKLVKVFVKPPTTQPWGTRSFYFRDPDGNLVDFYMPAKAR